MSDLMNKTLSILPFAVALSLLPTLNARPVPSPTPYKPITVRADSSYDPLKKYAKGNLVTYNGNSYLALGKIPAGVTPTSNTNLWSFFMGGLDDANVAIGLNAGQTNQGYYSVAIGNEAGVINQGTYSVALGPEAGVINQGVNAVALGGGAGFYNQASNSVAIGYNAGLSNQPANSIVLNATGAELDGSASGFFVEPIRQTTDTFATLYYNSTTGEITYQPNISDKRLKRNIQPVTNALGTVMALNPVTYDLKYKLSDTNYPVKDTGFIAQDLRKVLPELVKEGPGKEKILSVNLTPLIPILTKAVQQQQGEIAGLKAAEENQQKEINELKLMVKKLSGEKK